MGCMPEQRQRGCMPEQGGQPVCKWWCFIEQRQGRAHAGAEVEKFHAGADAGYLCASGVLSLMVLPTQAEVGYNIRYTRSCVCTGWCMNSFVDNLLLCIIESFSFVVSRKCLMYFQQLKLPKTV